VVRASALVAEARPDFRMVFMGGVHPNADLDPSGALALARAEAERTGAHGPAPTDVVDKFGRYVRPLLKDPDSLKDVVLVRGPEKGWFFQHEALLNDEVVIWGWFAVFSYNAKNSYGGYAGGSRYDVLFKDGQIVWASEAKYQRRRRY